MHDDRTLAEARAQRTIRERIRPAVHGPVHPVEVTAWEPPVSITDTPVGVADARAALAAGAFAPFEVGGRWGTPWSTVWFRLRGRVPDDWADVAGRGGSVELVVDIATGTGAGFQSEGLLHRTCPPEGPPDRPVPDRPVRGIHPHHQHVPLGLVVEDDGVTVDVLVEAAANPVVALSHVPTPLGDPATAGNRLQYRLRRAGLAVRHDDVWHLDLDLQVVVGLMESLSTDDPRRYDLLRAVDAAMDALDARDVPATAAAARAALAPVLARPAADHAHRTSAIGHAHIDSAWLWPIRETRRKCARTFASAVTLMDAYPEHRFVCSQAVQWAWIEEDHPELFAAMAEKVREGRFVPIGGSWVEADANLPSGESLARQLVWGVRFFESRFGIGPGQGGNRIGWIPDVFGYAGNLPQILALGGCDSFLTQKLSWNQTNAFPHHTFRWEGIDGTRVLTHFPPVDTYNGEVVPRELAFSVRNHRDKGRSARSVYLYGHGDGGGGPTREMVERARRIAGVTATGGPVPTDPPGLDGMPRLAIESPEAFFDAVRDEYVDQPSAAAPDGGPPVWRGELYFEMHRGTYTSQARTKVGNRRGELALRELELWTAPAPGAPAAPLADLERWWKDLLLQQFHDIIPGSSIAWVHDDAEAVHARLLAEVGAAVDEALAARDATPPGTAPAAVAANASPFAFAGVVQAGDGLRWADAPAMGVGSTTAALPDGVAPCSVTARADGTTVLANGVVTVVVGPDGTLASVVDERRGRELLAGPGGVLQAFPDVPNTYDAWDVEQHTLLLDPTEVTGVDRLDVVGDDPMRVAVRVRRTLGASRIDQTVVLRAGSARVDLVHDVDWAEREVLLKLAFPLDVRADDARFDVQYGHVRRPVHRNTSWDAARFEVCGHQWADVSEPGGPGGGFGVAVCNDGRYGHDVLGDGDTTTMRVSLLRAAGYPDPEADAGAHHVTVSLLPHDGTLVEVLPEAWALNLPPRVLPGAPSAPVVAADHPGVVVTAAKAADDGSGDLVVRYHEALGGRATVRLAVDPTWREAVPVDLHERPVGDPVPVVDGRVGRTLRPFRIETLRLRR